MVQRFAAGDHQEGRPGIGGGLGLRRQLGQGPLRMGRQGPGVLGVAPAATHLAARQPDEEGTAPGMDTLPLQ